MYRTDDLGNSIHSTAVIFEGAKIGKGNFFGPYCVIYPGVEIGNENVFVSHCSVGCLPQHKQFGKDYKGLVIGDKNTFREFCTLHAGTTSDTKIGNNNYLMAYCHVPHDAILKNNITIANSTQIGGHTEIEDNANIGLGCIIH